MDNYIHSGADCGQNTFIIPHPDFDLTNPRTQRLVLILFLLELDACGGGGGDGGPVASGNPPPLPTVPLEVQEGGDDDGQTPPVEGLKDIPRLVEQTVDKAPGNQGLSPNHDVDLSLVHSSNDRPPVFTHDAPAAVREDVATGETADDAAITYTAKATPDVEDDVVVYSLAETDDHASFGINANSGAVWFRSQPDYESGKTSYDFTVIATVGDQSAEQQVTDVTPVADPLEDGSGVVNIPSLTPTGSDQPEQRFSLTNFITDPDGESVTYSVEDYVDWISVSGTELVIETQAIMRAGTHTISIIGDTASDEQHTRTIEFNVNEVPLATPDSAPRVIDRKLGDPLNTINYNTYFKYYNGELDVTGRLRGPDDFNSQIELSDDGTLGGNMPDVEGFYRLTLTATPGDGLGGSQISFNILIFAKAVTTPVVPAPAFLTLPNMPDWQEPANHFVNGLMDAKGRDVLKGTDDRDVFVVDGHTAKVLEKADLIFGYQPLTDVLKIEKGSIAIHNDNRFDLDGDGNRDTIIFTSTSSAIAILDNYDGAIGTDLLNSRGEANPSAREQKDFVGVAGTGVGWQALSAMMMQMYSILMSLPRLASMRPIVFLTLTRATK